MPILDEPESDWKVRLRINFAYRYGMLNILHWQITKRFGGTPVWAEQRLRSMPDEDLERFSIGLLDASSLEDLLK
jgi:Domain of unknown function (DUF4351)